jgi:hypothetical protein
VGAEPPPNILKARTLLIEALKLLHHHGTMRIRRRDAHNGRSYVFTIEIPVNDTTSARDRISERP